MNTPVCTSIAAAPKPVGGYRIVRFPYGAGELYEASGMHPANQPDGTVISD
ncbi:hypothetical protein [Streptomyces acidicola]|uniref:hypothetical protein n=1 Tax=Streptomyces acidicola TaxID=2596892 RepID=UPI003F4E0E5A